jgi:hypothetical protein
MALKTILFIGLFAFCTVGALVHPILGVLGYVGHYSVGPEKQWWHGPLKGFGIRYSMTLALMTAIGMALQWRKLRFGRRLFERQEVFILVFLAVVWLSVLLGPETVGRYTKPGIDHPSVKLTKLVIFAMMLTHVVTDVRRLDMFLWVVTIGALVLGLQAYDTPRRAFVSGRLDTVGGPDFAEANVLAAYLAAVLPLIGVQFLRSGWIGKAVAALAGVFATNAIILTRSRGAVVGLAAGALAALLMAPKRFRAPVFIGIIAFSAGAFYLTDTGFRERASTVKAEAEDRDKSAQGRLDTWRASIRLLGEHPFGVGPGNFHQSIGKYDARYTGRDAHNTFVRAYSELGVHGFGVFGILIFMAFRGLHRAIKKLGHLADKDAKALQYFCYGSLVGLVIILACGLTITLLYVEMLWWFLALPVCMARSLENLELSKNGRIGEKAGSRHRTITESAGSSVPAAGEGALP